MVRRCSGSPRRRRLHGEWSSAKVGGLWCVVAALLLCSCASLSRGAFLRREGNVIASTEYLLEAYETEPRNDVQIQLLLSAVEAMTRVDRAYRRALGLQRLDQTREQWSVIDRHYKLVERAMEATRDNPSGSGSVAALVEQSALAFENVKDSRRSLRELGRRLTSRFGAVVDEGNTAIGGKDEGRLAEAVSTLQGLVADDEAVLIAFMDAQRVLSRTGEATANASALRVLIGSNKGKLPLDTVRVIEELTVAQEEEAEAAAVHARQARGKEARRDYERAVLLARAAHQLDGQVYGSLVQYEEALVEAMHLEAHGDRLGAVSRVLSAKELELDPVGANFELDRLVASAADHYEIMAEDPDLDIRERFGAVLALDELSHMTSTSTSARELERALASDLPTLPIRYDLARTNNDRGSRVYRVVQELLEHHAQTFGAEVDLVEILDQMSAYEGQTERRIGPSDVFLVRVDIVDYFATVERDHETLAVEYVSGYHKERRYNPEYRRWASWYQRNCVDVYWPDEISATLGTMACVASLASAPPEILIVEVADMATCRYRVTEHHLFGSAEARVEIVHVPDGSVYLDHQFSTSLQDVETEVEALQGDCAAAGIELRELRRAPMAKDVEDRVLRDLEAAVDAGFREALRPTTVLSWLSAAFPSRLGLEEYRLGSIFAESGLRGIYSHLEF